ncbi:MAG: rod shape-determining protein RodA, partial [Alphaproteobacteria bacterium]
MALEGTIASAARELRLAGKLRTLNWSIVLLVTLIASIGFALLYSVAGGSLEPWAGRQITRFGAGLVLLLVV